MLDDLREGRVRADVIVTHTLDRYSRNMVVALTTLAEMDARGITYSSVTESDFDYSNPDKRLHLSILAMFAEYFSEKLSQHTRKGKKERVANGLPNGDMPYGYANPDAGTERSGAGIFNVTVPVQVPEEAAHVRRAFELYATGSFTDLQIAKMLNAAGSRTRNKRADGPRPWSKDTVTALLTNPFYAGWVTYRGKGVSRSAPGERTKGKHEPDRQPALVRHGAGRTSSAGTAHDPARTPEADLPARGAVHLCALPRLLACPVPVARCVLPLHGGRAPTGRRLCCREAGRPGVRAGRADGRDHGALQAGSRLAPADHGRRSA
jgi:DNA invertase Pin-like site-specific DNA recombinase